MLDQVVREMMWNLTRYSFGVDGDVRIHNNREVHVKMLAVAFIELFKVCEFAYYPDESGEQWMSSIATELRRVALDLSCGRARWEYVDQDVQMGGISVDGAVDIEDSGFRWLCHCSRAGSDTEAQCVKLYGHNQNVWGVLDNNKKVVHTGRLYCRAECHSDWYPTPQAYPPT